MVYLPTMSEYRKAKETKPCSRSAVIQHLSLTWRGCANIHGSNDSIETIDWHTNKNVTAGKRCYSRLLRRFTTLNCRISFPRWENPVIVTRELRRHLLEWNWSDDSQVSQGQMEYNSFRWYHAWRWSHRRTGLNRSSILLEAEETHRWWKQSFLSD